MTRVFFTEYIGATPPGGFAMTDKPKTRARTEKQRRDRRNMLRRERRRKAREAKANTEAKRVSAPHPGTPLEIQLRSIQQTFRTTPEEHTRLVEMAREAGFGALSRFYRSKLGLTA